MTLGREVRYAAVATTTEDEFLTGLRAGGVLVRPRYSERTPGQLTGYAVALPANTTADGQPVWFGGGKLAPDLTWPRLHGRWAAGDASPPRAPRAAAPYREATEAAEQGLTELQTTGLADPSSARRPDRSDVRPADRHRACR